MLGDSVCRGCKRFSHEVIHWNAYTSEQKRVVDQRLQQLLTQIMRAYVEITDSELLHRQLTVNKVAGARHRNLYCRAHDLLRAGGGQIENLRDFGLSPVSSRRDLTAVQLKESIDADFQALSEAWYQRYFKVSGAAAERA